MKKCKEILERAGTIRRTVKPDSLPLSGTGNGDICDFTEAMKDVRPFAPAVRQIRQKPAKQATLYDRKSKHLNEKLLLAATLHDDNSFTVSNLPEYMEGFVDGMNPLVMERLRHGEFSIQKSIDLHGYSIEHGHDLFTFFLEEAIQDGLRCIKVIHGRGLKSRGEPVLKESLKTWIIRAMNRKWVLAFCSTVMRDGGPGATYILLRTKPEKKHIHVIG